MRLQSKGLGKLTLPFALDEAHIAVVDDGLWFNGRIQEKKVNWTYRMRLDDTDIVNFIELAARPEVVRFLARTLGLRLLVGMALQVGRTLLYFLGWKKAVHIPPSTNEILTDKPTTGPCLPSN